MKRMRTWFVKLIADGVAEALRCQPVASGGRTDRRGGGSWGTPGTATGGQGGGSGGAGGAGGVSSVVIVGPRGGGGGAREAV